MSLIVIILESSIGEGYDVLHFNTIIFLLLYFFNVLIANFKSSKFDNPEDLMMLNTKMIRSYLLPGSIVINSLGKKHLENLCKKTNKDLEIASKNFYEKKIKIKHYNTDLRLINKNKKHLALRWINLSIKQLFYRDRHIFNSIYKKIA